jgi:hypothetical protein
MPTQFEVCYSTNDDPYIVKSTSMAKVMSHWTAWFDRLTQKGKAKAGQPLAHEGKIVSGKKGRTVVDGPFLESKEAIAGYILLQVDDLNEALEIAKECPGLEYGVSIEVRPAVPRQDRCG